MAHVSGLPTAAPKCTLPPSFTAPAKNGTLWRKTQESLSHSMPSKWHWGMAPCSMQTSYFLFCICIFIFLYFYYYFNRTFTKQYISAYYWLCASTHSALIFISGRRRRRIIGSARTGARSVTSDRHERYTRTRPKASVSDIDGCSAEIASGSSDRLYVDWSTAYG